MGKNCIAHDEYIELGNCLFPMFPKAHTLKGMVWQGNFVGLVQHCKIFCQKYDASLDTSKRDTVTRLGTKAEQNPERKLICEVFTILLNEESPSQKLTSKLVSLIEKNPTVVLKNVKLESRVCDADKFTTT